MGIISAAVKHMLAGGMDTDAVVAAIAEMELDLGKDEAAERRRLADRERKRTTRLRKSADSAERYAPPDKESSPTPPKEINPPAPLPSGSVAARRFDELLDKLLEAQGIAGFRDEKAPGLANLAPIIGLIEAGYDLERDILATIRMRRKASVRSWAYYVPMIQEAGNTRRGVASQPKPAAAAIDWAARLEVFYASDTWSPAWGPKPGEPKCEAPTELIRARAA